MRESDWSSDVCSSDLSAEHILIMIGFAAVLQLMTLTFFMIRNRN
jgi:hypothetical protein